MLPDYRVTADKFNTMIQRNRSPIHRLKVMSVIDMLILAGGAKKSRTFDIDFFKHVLAKGREKISYILTKFT